MSVEVEKLSPMLFWDVAQNSVTWEQHGKWLLTRILERGTWEDWLFLTSHVSLNELIALEPKLKLPPREKTFLQKWIEKKHANKSG